MSDIPRRAMARTVKLASLPLGFAGRTALGFGKRVTGIDPETVTAEIQQR
ncbi:MAG: AarF/ABC1/UbiB kinase family protein, partial [Micromonosporaceae bacterium]